jgi:hypothetical protein
MDVDAVIMAVVAQKLMPLCLWMMLLLGLSYADGDSYGGTDVDAELLSLTEMTMTKMMMNKMMMEL